ncbi:hypothetical protein R3P38DRAFT_3224387 [Favolaschia claudopus]|uniref:Uncharacterized protein n=1 Tax=Favolaschia claudopus TaxID=2862362 RepID=A0AAV9ZW04_9AGAR
MLAQVYHPGSVAFRALRYSLSMVSPYWHTAVLQTVSFWSTVVISPSSTFDSVECVLARLGGLPFGLLVKDHYFNEDYTFDMPTSVVVRLLRVLLPENARITGLTITVRTESTLRLLMDFLERHPFPRIETLTISVLNFASSPMVVRPSSSVVPTTLKHLSLERIDCLSALTEAFPVLESLRIADIPAHSWPATNAFLRFVSSCGMLRTLEMHCVGLKEENSGVAVHDMFPRALSSLESLSLHFDHFVALGGTFALGNLFARLELPSLVSIELFFANTGSKLKPTCQAVA